MNLKKFISGVSALTIAASAFAGMAVTASALNADGSKTVTGFDSAKSVKASTLTLDEGVEDTVDNRISAFNTQAFGTDSDAIKIGRYSSSTCTALDAELKEGKLKVTGTLAKGSNNNFRGGFALYEGNATDRNYAKSQYIQFDVDEYSENVALALLYTKTSGTGSYGTQWSKSNAQADIELEDLGIQKGDTVKIGYDSTAKIANYYVNNRLKYTGVADNRVIHDLIVSAKNPNERQTINFNFTIYNFSADTYTAPTRTITYVSNGATASGAESAKEGTTVTVTVPTAEQGYVDPEISVVDGYNEAVTLTPVKDESENITGYTFTMPDSNITVTASATSKALTPPSYTPSENALASATGVNTAGSYTLINGADTYGRGYDLYAHADIFLSTATDSVTLDFYSSKQSGGKKYKLVCNFTFKNGELNLTDNDNTKGRSISPNIMYGNWYSIDLYKDLEGLINTTADDSHKDFIYTVKDASTGNTVVTGTMNMRNPQNGLEGIGYTLTSGAIVANSISYYLQDPYAISSNYDSNKGTVAISQSYAKSGDMITVTASAVEGYYIESVTAGSASVTNNGDGTYSFEMPAEAVTVNVTIKQTVPVVATQDDQGFTFESGIGAVRNLKVYVTKTENSVTKTSDGVSISGLLENEGTHIDGEGDVKFAVILQNIPETWSNISVKVAE